jgi:signal transduction histidine kinase/ActR/RegA family two-component response regulator
VAAALRDSTRQRQAAMTALQALNDGLEERVRQETATRVQAQEKLAQAQRMEALGQLAGGIAHDFNNVLQAVIGGLSLVTRRAEDPDQVRRFAAMAGSAADRGAAITGRLLTFARRGELKAAPIAVAPLLCGLQEMLAPTLGPGIAIRVQADPNLPPLFADQAQLETVLVNLAVNARDAMPDGGTLTLYARCETVAGGGPDGGTADAGPLPGDYLRLDMTDTGTGMDAATLARAAEPFFTTKGPGHGTGLGLAMARGFAAQSGGGFAIASAPGRGTCVTLWLPQMRPKDGAGPAEPGQRRLAVAHGINILLVDDDAMVRDILAGELEARGLCVTTAGDAVQALGLLDQGLLFDVMVTDYAMPGMNGVALIREVRRRIPAQPVLLLTGFAEAGAAAALSVSRDEMTRLLRKPISGDDLAAAAAGLHARARHFA